MDYPTLNKIEQDFSNSLGALVDLYNKAMKLTNRGYKFDIYPYRFSWGDGVFLPGGCIQVAKKRLLGTKWKTLVIFDTHDGKYFSLNQNPYRFYDVEGTYQAIEDIASSLISQLKTLEATLKVPHLEEKISNFSKEFDNIIKEME